MSAAAPGPLMAVPNISEGRDDATIEVIAAAFADGATDVCLLDVHRDPDHNRSVFTLAGPPGQIALALLNGARAAVGRIDLEAHAGVHPHVGALDVAPVVHLDDARRGAACAEALLAGDLLGDQLALPVFLYGALAGGRTRARIRRGGPQALADRIADGELTPDFGPDRLHATAGATLLAARPPLVAFNVDLRPPATLETARDIAARIREGGPEGLGGLKAIGLHLAEQGIVQVSTNVEDHHATPLAAVVDAVRAHALIQRAELVGLAPRAAFDGWPDDVPIPGFDPARHLIENRLDS